MLCHLYGTAVLTRIDRDIDEESGSDEIDVFRHIPDTEDVINFIAGDLQI